jgi:hypothetical protein
MANEFREKTLKNSRNNRDSPVWRFGATRMVAGIGRIKGFISQGIFVVGRPKSEQDDDFMLARSDE